MIISNTNSSMSNGRVSGFVPTVRPEEGTVLVVLLQRKRTEKDGGSDPRQKTRGNDGIENGTGSQVIMDLVGVFIPTTVMVDGKETTENICYPDPTGQHMLPELGSDEFIELMARPCGIWVESLYSDALVTIKNNIQFMPFTAEDLAKAEANKRVNLLLGTAGKALRQLGLIKKQQWTVGDVLFGGKAITVNLLADGEGDAFARGFTKLRGHFGFPNVAFIANMGTTLQATDLESGPSYTPSRVWFRWEKVQGTMGRMTYDLDPACALSGAEYASNATSSATASDLAKRSSSSSAIGSTTAVNDRMAARLKAQQDALQGGVKTPVYDPSVGL